jgi:hypothetical protein
MKMPKLPRCKKCGRLIRTVYMADPRTSLLGTHIVCPGLPDSTGLWKVSRILDALAGYITIEEAVHVR